MYRPLKIELFRNFLNLSVCSIGLDLNIFVYYRPELPLLCLRVMIIITLLADETKITYDMTLFASMLM